MYTQDPQHRLGTGSAVADLLLGIANTVNTGTVADSVERGHYLGGYFQDSWTVTQNLTLNLGVRYELFYPYIEVNNKMANFILEPNDLLFGQLVIAGDSSKPRSLLTLDKNNWAPRVGFAYRIPAVSNLVVRGSYGIFYAQDEGLGVTSRMTNNPPFFGYGGVSEIGDQLFPSSAFVLSSGALPTRPAPINPKDFVLNPNATTTLRSWEQRYTTPYVQEWHLTIEKQLPRDIVWQTSYVGNVGIHLWGQSQGNQPLVPGPGSPNNRRPLAQYTRASVLRFGAWNRSNYEGMSTRLEKRLGNGLSFLTSFTYGRAIDLQNPALDACDGCGSGNTAQNSYDLNAQRGIADGNVPLRFSFGGVWDLPVGRGHRFLSQGWTSAAVGSWQISTIYQAQSGHPFTVNLPFDNANVGNPSYPNRTCNGSLSNPTLGRYYDTSCFVTPASYTYGNSGRNILYGPGMNNFDFAVHRVFHLPVEHDTRLEFRAEAYNLFNHPQFGMPANTIGQPQSGTINSTSQPNRELQFALRLAF